MFDGRTLITTSEDKTLKIWDLTTKTCDFKILESQYIIDITILPNGKIAYITGNIIKIWG